LRQEDSVPPSLPSGFSLTANRKFLYEKFVEKVFPEEGKEDDLALTAPLSSALPPWPEAAAPQQHAVESAPGGRTESLYDNNLTAANAANPATSLHLSHDAGKAMLERLDAIEGGLEGEKQKENMEKRAKQVQKMWSDYWKRYGGAPQSVAHALPPHYSPAQPNQIAVHSSAQHAVGADGGASSSAVFPPQFRSSQAPPLMPQTARPAVSYQPQSQLAYQAANWAARPPSAPAAPFIYYPSGATSSSLTTPRTFMPLTAEGFANGFRPASVMTLQAQNVMRPSSQPQTARW
jgi:hypothetical protein